MVTEVMRPQDCLVDRFRDKSAKFHRRRNFAGDGNLKNLVVQPKQNNNKSNRKTSPKHDQKKRSNAKADNSKKSRDGGVADSRQHDEVRLVIGQVTLLRRGESLNSLAAKFKDGNDQNEKSQNQIPADDVAMSVKVGDRIVPESPNMVPKKIRLAVATETYAGSAFSLSPSPRAVPLPSFFNKKKKHDNNGEIVLHDSATRDLRRMLRLD